MNSSAAASVVRQLHQVSRPAARWAGAVALGVFLWAASVPIATAQDSQEEADVRALQAAGVAAEPAALLKFFRDRTLGEDELERIGGLVQQLDSGVYREREQAAKELLRVGRAALPVLRQATESGTLELRQRAAGLIEKLESSAESELTVAALHRLTALQPEGTVEALIRFHPFATDEWVREQLLAGLGRAAVRGGEADPVLLTALGDEAADTRGVAGYVLARYGTLGHRELVRKMLTDRDPAVARQVSVGLVGRELIQSQEEMLGSQRQLAAENGVEDSEKGLLGFFQSRTLTAADRQHIRDMVARLGAPSFRARELATQELCRRGTPALAYLRAALADSNPERVERAQVCVDRIMQGPGPALPVAALRLLTRYSPGPATQALLDYVPFADDDRVAEEVVNALCLLNLRGPQVEPALVEALGDELPGRRAAAAQALGRVGGPGDCAELPKLLADPGPEAQLGAARGLLAANDRSAVPALISLLGKLPADQVWKAEDTLCRLAGAAAPAAPLGAAGGKEREQAVKLWSAWWEKEGPGLELAGATLDGGHLGLLTICEYDSANFQAGGRVWECGRDGRQRWELRGVMGAMDAQVLPSGHVLVAENSARRVTERDKKGRIVWEYPLTRNPIACRRLPNGNTFIATYNEVLEVTAEKKLVYSHQRGQQFYIFSAEKLRDGRILCMTAQGDVIEMDSRTGKDLRTLRLGGGSWCGVELLPNGRYLVAQLSQNSVREVDGSGKTHWSVSYPGAFRATRLPNGHTVVVSMNLKKVAEFDRSGRMLREIECEGRPWMARVR